MWFVIIGRGSSGNQAQTNMWSCSLEGRLSSFIVVEILVPGKHEDIGLKLGYRGEKFWVGLFLLE